MKKIFSILIACVLVASFCIPATATDIRQDSTSISRAATAGSYYLTIDGVGYSVPDTTYVGYNHTTTGYYVGVAQKALNRVNARFANGAIPANCGVGTVDEVFGTNTFTGVWNFQAWVKRLGGPLTADGIVGPNTWGELSYYLIML